MSLKIAVILLLQKISFLQWYRNLLEKAAVAVADEIIHALYQSEFCRHSVTIPCTGFFVQQICQRQPPGGSVATLGGTVFLEPFTIFIVDDQLHIIFPLVGENHAQRAERNHENRYISVPHGWITPNISAFADSAFDGKLRGL